VWISSRATSEMPAEPTPAGDSAAGAPAKDRREARLQGRWLPRFFGPILFSVRLLTARLIRNFHKGAGCVFQAAAPKAAYLQLCFTCPKYPSSGEFFSNNNNLKYG
jgi:hypothetical protein